MRFHSKDWCALEGPDERGELAFETSVNAYGMPWGGAQQIKSHTCTLEMSILCQALLQLYFKLADYD